MKTITEFAGQNWLITPAALAFGERQPASIKEQKWLLTLSGVAIVNLKGNNVNGEWLRETLQILPDMSGALQFAISRFSVPVPANPGYVLKGSSKVTPLFQLEEWAPFASLGSIFDKNESINAGFAVDVWRPSPFLTLSANSLPDIKQIFQGIRVDVAVNDNDAILHRVNYHITLLGKIVFAQPDPCKTQEDAVINANNAVTAAQRPVPLLPNGKPDLVGIRIRDEELIVANQALESANRALTTCRALQNPGTIVF